jgi:hypothetical protein
VLRFGSLKEAKYRSTSLFDMRLAYHEPKRRPNGAMSVKGHLRRTCAISRMSALPPTAEIIEERSRNRVRCRARPRLALAYLAASVGKVVFCDDNHFVVIGGLLGLYVTRRRMK